VKILALLVAAGVGFAAVVYLLPRFTGHDTSAQPVQTAQNDPSPAPPPPPDPAPVAEEPVPAPAPAPPTPSTATALPAPPTPPSPKSPAVATPDPAAKAVAKQVETKPADTKPAVTKPAVTKPAVTKPADTKPAVTKPAETKPADPKSAETRPAGDPGCDEVACVLAKYNRPCCERYRPATTDLKPRAGNIPEELDRAMVRAGVEKIKPAVVACGEKTGVKGTVKLSVSVTSEGNVKSADVAEAPDEALGSCVAAAMRKARFGKSVKGGSFTYPFVF
jgi:TonB family protein